MTDPDDPAARREHLAVWELLPWYHTGALGPAEAARVAAHLGQCPRCRAELAATATVARAIRAADPVDALAAASLAAVTARMAPPARARHPWLLRGAIMAPSALLAVALLALVWPAAAPPGPATAGGAYVTLADAPTGLPVAAAPGVTEAAFRTRLHGLGLRIVDGPDAAGRYRLAPAAGGGFPAELLARVALAPELRLATPPAAAP